MAIQSNFPSLKPTLLLDFANTKQLDPRITFTRASTATYYGTQTAKAEENLLLQSQTLDNASWTSTNNTVVANAAAAPDGTTTAESLTASAANGTTTQSVAAIAGAYTFSVWLRRVTGTGNIDISAHSGGTWVTQTITSTWARYTVTQTLTAGTRTPGIRIVTSGDAIEIWGAQLEQRSAVTAYTPTTSAPITNYIPVLQTAASGVARFEHNPVTGESLGLEIEESRTNLVTYSEQFDNAAWTKSNTTITANTIVAPDGALTGDKLVEDTSSGNHDVRQSVTTTAADHSFSVYLKSSERQFALLWNATADFGRVFNLSNGTVSGTVTGVTQATASISNVGNGWYRCTITGTCTAASNNFRIYAMTDATTFSYTGDGYSGIYIWGAQLEAGAFATSYIPTVASQVTRAADAASMTGTNFSSWYNAGQGSLYSEASVYDVSSARGAFVINDGTTSNRILTGHGANPKGFIVTGGTSQMSQSITTVTFSANTFSKVSLAYADNNGNTAANGTIGTLDTAMTIPVVTQLQIGSQTASAATTLNGSIKKLAYYPIRCTDAQLQALTS